MNRIIYHFDNLILFIINEGIGWLVFLNFAESSKIQQNHQFETIQNHRYNLMQLTCEDE